MTGIKVMHDYFSSEPEMLTKMRTNPGAYDVVLINSARNQQAEGEGLLHRSISPKITNAAGLSPDLREHANLKADGKVYGCAWVWGMTALAVREGITKADTWTLLSDPKYAGSRSVRRRGHRRSASGRCCRVRTRTTRRT